MAWIARKAVSERKYRYQEDGFDLDLSYIVQDVQHGDIIAMGVPVSGLWRNPRSEVRRLLDLRYPHAHRVYNLCSEAAFRYPASKFGGSLASFPFDDHQVPPLGLIAAFCIDASSFLAAAPGRAIAVHCKAGRGRTGVMVCAYLLHSGMCKTPDEAIALFGAARSVDGIGITIPSQMRYLEYYHRMLLGSWPCRPPELQLLHVSFQGAKLCHRVVMSTRAEMDIQPRILLTIDCNSGARIATKFKDDKHWQACVRNETLLAEASTTKQCCTCTGDILVQIFDGPGSNARTLAYCWFNTCALSPTLEFIANRVQLDKVKPAVPAEARLTLQFGPWPSAE